MAVKKSELYSTLWKCCDELRGGMDASQYKDYVLVILFVKYISDKKLNDEGFDIDIGEFYQFNLSSCIRQQNSLTAQFVSFSLSNLANIFYPPPIFTIINLCLL